MNAQVRSDWSAQDSATRKTLLGVDFVDANNGWAVGWSGTIVGTTNGGATWIHQTSGTTEQLRAVDFIDPSNGWSVGESGTILGTTDGGATWSPQASGTTNDLRDVFFLSPQQGWAVGTRGTTLAFGGPPVLVSHLDETSAQSGPNLRLKDFGQAFTTGSNTEGSLLTGVLMDMRFGADGARYDVRVASDFEGAPGSSLATLTAPRQQITGKVRFTHPGLLLQADTTY